jgi:hypothetical protein
MLLYCTTSVVKVMNITDVFKWIEWDSTAYALSAGLHVRIGAHKYRRG